MSGSPIFRKTRTAKKAATEINAQGTVTPDRPPPPVPTEAPHRLSRAEVRRRPGRPALSANPLRAVVRPTNHIPVPVKPYRPLTRSQTRPTNRPRRTKVVSIPGVSTHPRSDSPEVLYHSFVYEHPPRKTEAEKKKKSKTAATTSTSTSTTNTSNRQNIYVKPPTEPQRPRDDIRIPQGAVPSLFRDKKPLVYKLQDGKFVSVDELIERPPRPPTPTPPAVQISTSQVIESILQQPPTITEPYLLQRTREYGQKLLDIRTQFLAPYIQKRNITSVPGEASTSTGKTSTVARRLFTSAAENTDTSSERSERAASSSQKTPVKPKLFHKPKSPRIPPASSNSKLHHCDGSYSSATHWLLPENTYEKQAYRLWYQHYQTNEKANRITRQYDATAYIAKIKRAEANEELIEPAYTLYLEERRPYLLIPNPPEWTFQKFNLEQYANKVRHNRNLRRPDLFVSPDKIPPPAPVPTTISAEAPQQLTSSPSTSARSYKVTFSVAGQPLIYHCSVAHPPDAPADPTIVQHMPEIPTQTSVFDHYPWAVPSDLEPPIVTQIKENIRDVKEIDRRITETQQHFKAVQLPRHYGIHFLGAIAPQPYNYDGNAILDDPSIPQRRFSQVYPIYWKLTEDLNKPQTTAFKTFRISEQHIAYLKSKSELEAEIESFYAVADDFRKNPDKYGDITRFQIRLQNLRRSWAFRHRAIGSIDLIPPDFHYYAQQNVISLNTYEGIQTRTGTLQSYLSIRLGLLTPSRFEDTTTSAFVVEIISSALSYVPPIVFKSLQADDNTPNSYHVDKKWRIDLSAIKIKHYSENQQEFPRSSIEIYPKPESTADSLQTKQFINQRMSKIFRTESNYGRDYNTHLYFCNRFGAARNQYFKDCEQAEKEGRQRPLFNEPHYLHIALVNEINLYRQQIAPKYSNTTCFKRPGDPPTDQPQSKINKVEINTQLPGLLLQQTTADLQYRHLRTSIAAISLQDTPPITTTAPSQAPSQQGASRYPEQHIPAFGHSIDNILQQHVPAADRPLPSYQIDDQRSSSDEDEPRLYICEEPPASPTQSIYTDNPEDISDQPTDLTIPKQV